MMNNFICYRNMPDKCCVPACTGNYSSATEKVSVFRFPKDPVLREKWIRNIPRDPKDYTINEHTVVCDKHFAAEFVVREDVVTRADGSELRMRRERPKLAKDAYPSIFPNTPSYLSTEPPRKRRAPEERRFELSLRDKEDFDK